MQPSQHFTGTHVTLATGSAQVISVGPRKRALVTNTPMTSSERVVIQIGPSIKQREASTMPTVEISKVGKVASAIIFLTCLFSLGLWKASGYYIIDPPFSLLILAIAALFYFESVWLERQVKSEKNQSK